MKKILIGTILAVTIGISLLAFKVCAEPHWNNQTTLMAQDDGDSIRPFSVTISSSATLIYFSTQTAAPSRTTETSVDRFLAIQNQTSFDVYCTTFAATNPLVVPRWVIYSTVTAATSLFSQWITYSAPTRIYCAENTATTTTGPLIGWIGYDSGD